MALLKELGGRGHWRWCLRPWGIATPYVSKIEGKATGCLPSVLLNGPRTYGKWLKEEAYVHVGCVSSSFIFTLFVLVTSMARYGSSEPLSPLEAP